MPTKNPPKAVNAIGIPQRRKNPTGRYGRRKHGTMTKYSSQEDRAAIAEWRKKVAEVSCCVASFAMETVNLNETLARSFGLPTKCPVRCPAYVALYGIPMEMEPC